MANQCQHVSESRGPCVNAALPLHAFCIVHTCPLCGLGKQGDATSCALHTGLFDNPNRCQQNSGAKGVCSNPARKGKAYCTFHACPYCAQPKASTASACPLHLVVPGSLVVCQHVSSLEGKCMRAAAPGSVLCPLHTCPRCTMARSNGSPACPVHRFPLFRM
eukprot:GGOE01058749.1.p2 GENE.GGOE01058749.1~~GGOE01058749.1.p2  ORF type:complete len:169 (+),score=22.83 GGOE01058749.1:22-507(+)